MFSSSSMKWKCENMRRDIYLISNFSYIFHIFSESVEKKCGYNGRWESQNGTGTNEYLSIGWANYTTCLPPEMLRLHYRVYNNNVDGEVSIIQRL